LYGEGPSFLIVKVTLPTETVALSSAITKSFSTTLTVLPPVADAFAAVVATLVLAGAAVLAAAYAPTVTGTIHQPLYW